MKIIFLDIDGVLNTHNPHANGCGRIERDPVDRLNSILKQVPDAQIVLTSAWRYSFRNATSIMALLMSHGVNCLNRVHGRTDFDDAQTDGEYPEWTDRESWNRLGLRWRKEQILDYLQGLNDFCRQYVTNFVVIDDLPLDVGNLVQTDPRVGLTKMDAFQAIGLLDGTFSVPCDCCGSEQEHKMSCPVRRSAK